MLEYSVNARRLDAHGSEANTKDATITLDTDVKGRADAFNPAECPSSEVLGQWGFGFSGGLGSSGVDI